MSEKFKGLIALTVATFIGGAILPSLIRTGVSTIHPVIFTFFRTGLSALISFFLIQKHWPQLKREWRQSIKIMGLLGLALAGNILLFSIGVSRTTLIMSQLMYTILPITTGLVGFIWLKEKLPPQKVWGAIIAIIGVATLVILSQKSSQQLSLGTFLGNSIILSAVCSYTMFFILSKRFSQHYSSLVLSTLSSAGAALFTLPIALLLVMSNGQSHISGASWLSALAIGVLSTLFLFLVQYGIKRLSTMTGAVITQLSPEFAALAGILIYHEQLSLVLIFSLVLVTAGVMLSVQTEPVSIIEKIKGLARHLPFIK